MKNSVPEDKTREWQQDLLIIIIIAAVNLALKSIPAAILELDNDEVYYWTYALFPALSHFDHPPMVGFLIQLFTLNLKLPGDFFIRAGSLVLSFADIIILFFLVRRLYSRRAAYLAVAMYLSSIYYNIISGFNILPDTPQVFFILFALSFLLPSITRRDPDRRDKMNIVIFGIFTGFAFLSKYHSLFLWAGAGLYILFSNRIWLKKPALYLGILATIIISLPVFYWNFKNDFVSFTFHGERIGILQNPVNIVTFLQFNIGQILYQNPILFVIYFIMVFKAFRNRNKVRDVTGTALLWLGLPLIIVFMFISLFRFAYPHWTGPAFICLVILSSGLIAQENSNFIRRINGWLGAAMALLLTVIILSSLQIRTGFLPVMKDNNPVYPGKKDITLDMFGWKQARERFSEFLVRDGIMPEEHAQVAIISDNWFPAAHIDHYIAHPLNIRLLVPGDIERSHKYFWIDKTRKLTRSDIIFYVTDSRNYQDPEYLKACFSAIIPADTLPVYRNKRLAKKIFIYKMAGLKCDSALYMAHPGF